MNCYLYKNEDEQLVEMAARFEAILINSWLFKWKLNQFPSILIVKCNTQTLMEISKNYKAFKISGAKSRETVNFFYVKEL